MSKKDKKEKKGKFPTVLYVMKENQGTEDEYLGAHDNVEDCLSDTFPEELMRIAVYKLDTVKEFTLKVEVKKA